MKKILAMCLLMPSLVLADPQIKTYQAMCLNGEDLTNTVDEFKELPYVRGLSAPLAQPDARLSLVIFLNPITGTFTIAEKAADDFYCVIAVGNKFEPVPKNIQDDARQQQEKSAL